MRRTSKMFKALLGSGLVFLLGFALAVPAVAQMDTTPPELVNFSISPLIIDTSGGPATLSVRIEARDDLSGFGSGSTGNGSIDIRHSSGGNPFGRGSLPITGGTALNPVFEFSLTAPQFSLQGIYPISLTLIDNVFNKVTLSSADLAARGFPSQIEVTPLVITVAIDVKPGSFPNSVNPRSHGKIPVAILTTDTFDAAAVDPSTARFGATGTNAAPVHSALEDVDGDADIDMILHFNTQTTGIQCGDTSASLTGETFSGQAIKGSDSVNTVGCSTKLIRLHKLSKRR